MTEQLEAWGVKVPLQPWAVSLVALLVIAGLSLVIWQKVAEPEKALLSLREVNDRLASDVEEYGRHAMEEPTKHELFEDADGGLALRVYTDHCVLIQRRTLDGVLTKLVPDLMRDRPRRAVLQIAAPTFDVFPRLEAAQACNRGCLNPHPGQFQWWYGGRQGDWVEVWRRWPDGCTHVHLFHPPSGAWATNRDGTPNVRWTCCVH